MKKIKILHKSFSKPISCLTAYSPSIANILDGKIDLILVGDSIGSTLYGMNNTQGVTMDMMKNHGAAVNKTIKKSLKVLDMPYKTYDNKIDAYKNAKILLNHCRPDLLKIEINKKKLVVLKHLVDKKVNVQDLVNVIANVDKNLISNIKVFDVYEGENIPSDKKSIALNVTIQSSMKTLNDNDLEKINNLIISTVENKSGAKIRS